MIQLPVAAMLFPGITASLPLPAYAFTDLSEVSTGVGDGLKYVPCLVALCTTT